MHEFDAGNIQDISIVNSRDCAIEGDCTVSKILEC